MRKVENQQCRKLETVENQKKGGYRKKEEIGKIRKSEKN